MAGHGKVVGKHRFSTVLGSYDLEVRFDMSDGGEFAALVPKSFGEKVVVRDFRTFERVVGKTFEELKQNVVAYLRERDTTEYEDVIEYSLDSGWGNSNTAGFDFRVARVSKVCRDGTDEPRMEISVFVGDDLVVSPLDFGPVKPCSYQNVLHVDGRMPYSQDRLLKCRAIRDGVAELRKRLKDLFAEDGSASANLDRLSHAGRLLAGVPDSEEVSR